MDLNHRLRDRVAIVSGAGSGIGAGTAKELAAQGARVIIAELDPESGAGVAAEIRAAGHEAAFVACDVREEKSIASMIEAAIRQYQKIDILVNNAGITQVVNLDMMSPEEWDQLLSVNLRSMFLMTRACLPYLRRSEGAAIVNMSSVNAWVTLGALSAYAASKAGIVGFTKSLAAELAPRIRVNAIAPGAILTDAWKDRDKLDQVLAHRLKYIPLERMGAPKDVGQGVAFLVSDHAAYITGTVLTIDGGMTARLYDGQV
ncbi:MAG: SDR family NAD(P)-dependent oxidoreductase [Chloroflexota bacterium]|nr:SDR family NAD(P)-dependent oxidoreductase [Chloroflexota bacterium]